jgi:hypothetical protein
MLWFPQEFYPLRLYPLKTKVVDFAAPPLFALRQALNPNLTFSLKDRAHTISNLEISHHKRRRILGLK